MNTAVAVVSKDRQPSNRIAFHRNSILALVATVLVTMACSWLLASGSRTASAAPAACVPGPHSGTISASQDWCLADSPHVINGGLSVAPGAVVSEVG